MNCSRYKDKWHSFVKGSLSEAEQLALKAHLEGCQNCRQIVYDIRLTENFFNKNREIVKPPLDLKQDIMTAIDLNRYKKVKVKKSFGLANWGKSMIAAGFILFITNMLPIGYDMSQQSYLYDMGSTLGKQIVIPLNRLGEGANIAFGKLVALNGITIRIEKQIKGGM